MVANSLAARVESPCEVVADKAVTSLKENALNVVTKMDLRHQLGNGSAYFVIICACDASASGAPLDNSLPLPCNVTVRADGDGSMISILNPEMTASASGRKDLADVARSARETLERILDELVAAA